MFDIGWGKLLVIAAVALIVVGPKDLIPMLRTLGRFTAKVRQMAGEFQHQFNEAMREADLTAVREELEAANRDIRRSLDPSATGSASPPRTDLQDESDNTGS